MPHFFIQTNGDGSVRQIFKDGLPHNRGLVLEQHYSVVKTYFTIAKRNLESLQAAHSDEDKRCFGLQSFLMSLTGLEAFANTYFHQRANELGNNAMLSRIDQTHGSITNKVRDLLEISGDGPLQDQEMLMDRLWDLTQLRHEIVHPRWQPAGFSISGDIELRIEGLVENRQKLFEDFTLCHEALNWCLLLVARVAQSLDNDDVRGFMFYWTGNYELELASLLSDLGLPAES